MKRITLGYLLSAGVSFAKNRCAKLIGAIFYNPKFLTGRYFDKYRYSEGWKWVVHSFYMQKIVGYQRHLPFPAHPANLVMNWENIHFHPDDIGMFQRPGSYFQAAPDAHIYIGRGTAMAGNVGFITSNHDVYNYDNHLPGKDIVIGTDCWIGMNSVILPGVKIGDHTVVGAGSVVTHSFPQGYCVIAGNPAKVIRELDPQKCENSLE